MLWSVAYTKIGHLEGWRTSCPRGKCANKQIQSLHSHFLKGTEQIVCSKPLNTHMKHSNSSYLLQRKQWAKLEHRMIATRFHAVVLYIVITRTQQNSFVGTKRMNYAMLQNMWYYSSFKPGDLIFTIEMLATIATTELFLLVNISSNFFQTWNISSGFLSTAQFQY